MLTTVVSQVADAYFGLRALDLQLEIAQRTLASRQESLQLTQVRESGGVTSLLDVREAEQLVFGAGAAIAESGASDRAAGEPDQHPARRTSRRRSRAAAR